MGDVAVATAWQLRLMVLRFVAGLLPLAVLFLVCFFLSFVPPFVPLCSHFYAGTIFNTRTRKGGECLGDAAVATAWQLRLKSLLFVAGFCTW